MNDVFLNRYRIPSARAQWHDYNGGSYFITICTRNREHYFGEINNGVMELSEIGEYSQQSIQKIELLHDDILVPVFQVMPNHIHLILVVDSTHVDLSGVGLSSIETPYYDVSTFNGSPANHSKMRDIANQCGRMSHVISRFKSSVTKYARHHNIDFNWQSRFHDHIIRDLKEWDLITNYIINNVSNWNRDKFHG